MPVAIFTHGINQHRNICSGLCRELSSQGIAVFSVEHNDGTASCSFDEKELKMEYYKDMDLGDMGVW